MLHPVDPAGHFSGSASVTQNRQISHRQRNMAPGSFKDHLFLLMRSKLVFGKIGKIGKFHTWLHSKSHFGSLGAVQLRDVNNQRAIKWSNNTKKEPGPFFQFESKLAFVRKDNWRKLPLWLWTSAANISRCQ